MSQKIVTTLCLLYQHPRILLGMKKKGFGAGLWNGFGGKVQENESVIDATHREMYEECSLRVSRLKEVGQLVFKFENRPEHIEMHLFSTDEYQGVEFESAEMKPQWFMIDEIPFMEMWSSDRYWYPLFLKNKKFKGEFLFDASDQVVEHTLEEVEK